MPRSDNKTGNFVVSGISEDALVEALAPLDLVEHRVVARDPTLVVLVTLAGCDPDPQEALLEIRKRLGGRGRIQRAMHDEHGAEILPTGTIQVRFKGTPTDQDLARFGEKTGLRVIKRNEFQPKQAAFEPVNLNDDLENAIGKVEKLTEVRKAWPEVLSNYKRS